MSEDQNINIKINQKEIQVNKNLTVMQACEIAGEEIPRFCYHDKLSIAGNCRMCLVEIEKAPKLVSSCTMPLMEGMSIITNSKKLMMTAKQYYRIATPGIGEICANAVLQMYGSIFRGISDGCMFKNSKVGGQKFALLNTALAASTIANPEPQPE